MIAIALIILFIVLFVLLAILTFARDLLASFLSAVVGLFRRGDRAKRNQRGARPYAVATAKKRKYSLTLTANTLILRRSRNKNLVGSL